MIYTFPMSHTGLSQKVIVDIEGQIQISIEFCKALQINEGDDMTMILEGDHIEIMTLKVRAKRLRAILKVSDARDLTSELLEERRLEAKCKGF